MGKIILPREFKVYLGHYKKLISENKKKLEKEKNKSEALDKKIKRLSKTDSILMDIFYISAGAMILSFLLSFSEIIAFETMRTINFILVGLVPTSFVASTITEIKKNKLGDKTDKIDDKIIDLTIENNGLSKKIAKVKDLLSREEVPKYACEKKTNGISINDALAVLTAPSIDDAIDILNIKRDYINGNQGEDETIKQASQHKLGSQIKPLK